MRLSSIAVAVMGIGVATAAERTASIYVQPVAVPPSSEPKPALLAEVRYQTPVPSEYEVFSYEAPDLPEDAKLLRLGVYDPSSARWVSSTSVASVENFGKGYAPHFVVTVGGQRGEEVLGVSVRGVRIDAGHTRDFGPQVIVVPTAQGKQPDLNKPVVLSPEGRKVQPEVEKSFLQKYVAYSLDPALRMLWWPVANLTQVLVGAGDRGCSSYGRWRRRQISKSNTTPRLLTVLPHVLCSLCAVLVVPVNAACI
jgi:hypothetical protein